MQSRGYGVGSEEIPARLACPSPVGVVSVQGAGGEGHGSDAPGAATDERGEAGEPEGGALAGEGGRGSGWGSRAGVRGTPGLTATITAKPPAPPGPGVPA